MFFIFCSERAADARALLRGRPRTGLLRPPEPPEGGDARVREKEKGSARILDDFSRCTLVF